MYEIIDVHEKPEIYELVFKKQPTMWTSVPKVDETTNKIYYHVLMCFNNQKGEIHEQTN